MTKKNNSSLPVAEQKPRRSPLDKFQLFYEEIPLVTNKDENKHSIKSQKSRLVRKSKHY